MEGGLNTVSGLAAADFLARRWDGCWFLRGVRRLGVQGIGEEEWKRGRAGLRNDGMCVLVVGVNQQQSALEFGWVTGVGRKGLVAGNWR